MRTVCSSAAKVIEQLANGKQRVNDMWLLRESGDVSLQRAVVAAGGMEGAHGEAARPVTTDSEGLPEMDLAKELLKIITKKLWGD